MDDNEDKGLVVFENKKIRRIFHNEEWYYSVVDVVGILTDSPFPRTYWQKVKDKDFQDIELYPIWVQLKLRSSDGKFYETDCANTEGMFRIIQSIPSKKAEPFKLWLARVGYERIQEIQDPSLSIDRGRKNWFLHGYSEKWIQQRMMGQEIRNKLTDYWKNHEIKEGDEFAILTNIIHKEWTGLNVKEHKKLKGLKKQNLRDHMTDAELVFTALAEFSTREVAESTKAIGLPENKVAGKIGGGVAKKARIYLEKKTSKKVISTTNNLKIQNQKVLKEKKE